VAAAVVWLLEVCFDSEKDDGRDVETFGRGGERLMGDEVVCIWEKKEEQRRWDCTILGKEERSY
ncbi:hypothetical protein MTR67_027339, partial [Solanum verrucosum]